MPALNDQVDALFARWDKADSPGCAVAIIQDGTVVHRRGYGMADLEQRRAITPGSVFYLCSTGKQFAGMAIALLVEDGTIRLDDDIRKYVPEMPDYGVPITIRHLVHHTSGLRDYLEMGRLMGRSIEDVWTEPQVVALLAQQKALNFMPGEQYLYTNSGYVMLAVVVRRATGLSLREFADQRIFRPLGMQRSFFCDDHGLLIEDRVSGYLPCAAGGCANAYVHLETMGDGGMFTTLDDLCLWDANFYDNRLGKGGQGLIDLLHSTMALNDGTQHWYAFGLGNESYRGLKTVAHPGGLLGYRTQMIRFPAQRFTAICLANTPEINPDAMVLRIADLYLAEHFTEAAPDAGQPEANEQAASPALSVSPEALAACAGRYYSEELQCVYDLALQEDALCLTNWRMTLPLETRTADTFAAPNLQLRLLRAASDKVCGFEVSTPRVKNLRFVRMMEQ